MSLAQAGRRAARQLSSLTADGLRCFSAAAPGPDMMEVFVNDVSVHVPKGVSVLQVRCRWERAPGLVVQMCAHTRNIQWSAGTTQSLLCLSLTQQTHHAQSC